MTRCFAVHNFSIKTRELVWSCRHSYSQQARACVKVISLRTHVCDNARGEIRLSDWQAALGWVFHSAAKKSLHWATRSAFLPIRDFQVKVMSKETNLGTWTELAVRICLKSSDFPSAVQSRRVLQDGRSFIDLMLLLLQPAGQQDPRCQSPGVRFLCRAASRCSSECSVQTTTLPAKKMVQSHKTH